MWQPQNCAVAGRNYWMPHDQEASTQDFKENSTYIDELWEARHPELLRPCSAIHKSIINRLYKRPGLCEDGALVDPWVIAKHRRVFLASYERDVRAMSKILLRHDTLFTLARHYDVHADHNIEQILHQCLISST